MRRPTFKHYQELADLIKFFKAWYGRRWEMKTREAAGCYQGEILGAQHGREAFSSELLPKLRRLKMKLEIK